MVDQARHKKLQLASTSSSWHFFVVKFAIDSSAAMYNIAIANYYFFDGEVSFFSVVGSC